jgi:histidinol-phosphate phosphatase family protein
MAIGKRPAVFLDRDGTLIEDRSYLTDPDQVRLMAGVCESLAELSKKGFPLVVVSNQSGLGRGRITPEQGQAVHERLVRDLAAGGVVLDDVVYCPHAPEEGCPCRKPRPGMILEAAARLGLSLENSVMVGDRDSDVEAGKAAGCRTILLGENARDSRPDWLARNWSQVLALILATGSIRQ